MWKGEHKQAVAVLGDGMTDGVKKEVMGIEAMVFQARYFLGENTAVVCFG